VKAFELDIDGVATFTVDPAVHSPVGRTGLCLITRPGPVISPIRNY
jgi:hypothetical protein